MNKQGTVKRIQKKYVFRLICGIIIMLLMTATFAFVWVRYASVHNTTGHLEGTGNIAMALFIYLGLSVIVTRWMGGFKIGVNRKLNVVASQILSALVVDFLEVFISLAILGQFRYFWPIFWRYLLLFAVQSVLLAAFTIPAINLYRKVIKPFHMIEVYGKKADLENSLYEKLNSLPYKFQVEKKVLCPEDISVLTDEFAKYDAVVLNDLEDEQQNSLIKLCFAINKRVYYVPKISDIIISSADTMNLFDTPLDLNRNNGISIFRLAVKRLLDILISLIALIILSPGFLIVALCIKLEDKGPVFYRQDRVTLNGKVFKIIKFRSMIVDAEKDGRSHPAGQKDDRITKIGRVIRAIRFDELPQLINVLKGDMSIVGPRPERVEHVELYAKQIPEFHFREKVRGGLTGYAQVFGKYNTSALDKLKMDVIYITNYSLTMDLQILFETVKILFMKVTRIHLLSPEWDKEGDRRVCALLSWI